MPSAHELEPNTSRSAPSGDAASQWSRDTFDVMFRGRSRADLSTSFFATDAS